MKQNQETQQTDINTEEVITEEEKGHGFHINVNIILLCVILLIAALSAYRLYKWNKRVP